MILNSPTTSPQSSVVKDWIQHLKDAWRIGKGLLVNGIQMKIFSFCSFLGKVPGSLKFSEVPVGNLSHLFLLPEEFSDDYLMISSWIQIPQWAVENA